MTDNKPLDHFHVGSLGWGGDELIGKLSDDKKDYVFTCIGSYEPTRIVGSLEKRDVKDLIKALQEALKLMERKKNDTKRSKN